MKTQCSCPLKIEAMPWKRMEGGIVEVIRRLEIAETNVGKAYETQESCSDYWIETANI